MLDSDRQIALSSLPSRLRPAFAALWAVDAGDGRCRRHRAPSRHSARSGSPGGARRCEGLDQAEPPAEPRLQAVAEHLIPHGVTGRGIGRGSRMAGSLLEPFPWTEPGGRIDPRAGRICSALARACSARNRRTPKPPGACGRWSTSRAIAATPIADDAPCRSAKVVAGIGPDKPPRNLRPLTALAAVAAHDASGGSELPAAAWSRWSHTLIGRFPRG